MKLGITVLIYNKDDNEFVTEFPCLLGQPKEVRIVEDRALGIYPNSVYALYTSLAAVLVLNSNNQH